MENKNLLVSIQKCGTHLMWGILDSAGLKRVSVRRNPGDSLSPVLMDLAGIHKNQYLWSHHIPSASIRRAIEGRDDIKVIFNFRDPRDVVVSQFCWVFSDKKLGGKTDHQKAYMRKVYEHLSREELLTSYIKVDKFIEEEYNPIEYFYWGRTLLFHPKVHNIRFEDLIGSKGGGDDEVQKETIAGLFDYLEMEANIDEIAKNAFNPNSETFRKGQIGDWKNVMTKEQIELFNRLHGDMLKQYGYLN